MYTLTNSSIIKIVAPGRKGDTGYTPIIGENGNWWVAGEDTGYPSFNNFILTVNNKDKVSGTNNINLYASDIAMSVTDKTTLTQKLNAISTDLGTKIAGAKIGDSYVVSIDSNGNLAFPAYLSQSNINKIGTDANSYTDTKVSTLKTSVDANTSSISSINQQLETLTGSGAGSIDAKIEAAKYTLPTASSSAIGGVKSGTDITVDSNGNVNVVNDSHTHGNTSITSVDGSKISSGTIPAARLPEASTSTKGAMTAAMVTKLNGITESADSVSFTQTATSGNEVGMITINGTDTTLYAPVQTTISGNASTATKLTTSAGSATQPVYFSDGKPVATTHTLGKSVPSDAKFTDTTYSDMKGATSSADGTHGLVPAPAAGNQSKYLRGDGTWATPTNTTYTAGTGLTLSGTKFNHTNSVTAGTAKGTDTSTLSFGGTFTIPTVTYDAQGHITGAGSTTLTLPNVTEITNNVNGKVDKVEGKGLSTNDYTTAEKNKLAGIAANAEVNQNAFSNVVIGSTTIAADSKTDSLTLVAGNNITLTPDATNDKITIATSVSVDSALSSTSTNAIQNKAVNTAIINLNTLVGSKSVGTQIDEKITALNLDTTYIKATTKGANNGLAELDSNGKVPSSQLPSYVDDVLEYTAKANFPSTGETGKIYVDTTTNLTYRWSGSGYTEISPSLALGTTSSTAFRGDYGNTAYTHATAKGAAFSSGLYKITTNAQGHVTAATAVTKSDITGLGIPESDTSYSDMKGATSSAAGTHGLVPAPAAGKQASYLRGDGTWAVPTNTTYTAGDGLTLSGTKFSHSNSVTAGTAQGDASKTLTFGGTFKVPTITYDAQGHITGSSTTTMTMPANPNSDTKVTQTLTTNDASYPLLLAPSGQTANATTTSYFDSGVTLNPSTNTIAANISGNAGSATKLTTSAGSATQPVYFSDGKPVATTYTLSKSVPSDAKFTDTTYSDMTAATSSAAGTHGLVPAPAAGKQTSFLRGDGTWAVPTNTTYSAGTGLTLSGTAINHSNSVTASTAQGDANKTLTFGGTFTIPTITYDAQGHITGKGTTTMTMPSNPNSDTKVNVTLATTTKAYLLGTSTTPTSTAAGVTAIADTGVYLDTTAGKLTAGSFAGNGASLTSLNASNISSGTIAAARLPAASTSAQGAMTAAMVTKLNGITESADAVSFTQTAISGNEVGKITINGTETTLYAPVQTTISGNASTATKLTSSAGSATQPVYFSDGKPVATTYTLGKSVPSDAKFTDTTYSDMTGASASAAGTHGLVPAPAADDKDKFLKGDGTWSTVDTGSVAILYTYVEE